MVLHCPLAVWFRLARSGVWSNAAQCQAKPNRCPTPRCSPRRSAASSRPTISGVFWPRRTFDQGIRRHRSLAPPRGSLLFPPHSLAPAARPGLGPRQRGPKSKHDPLFEEVRKLKQENGHLAQRLVRAELIIDVQKKVSSLLGIPLATVDSDESNS